MGLQELLGGLRMELTALEKELKIDIPKKIEAARSLGDLAENAEYHAIKERQGFVQARILSLRQRIASLAAIDPRSVPRDRAGFGSIVHLLDTDSGGERVVKLVAPEESNGEKGWVSMASPIGRGLVGRREGEEVRIQTPVGVKVFEVIKIITLHEQEKPFSA
ncbi:MAG: GreA/GreB family elongation factor [Candidatus Methylomirabilales bacterium]